MQAEIKKLKRQKAEEISDSAPVIGKEGELIIKRTAALAKNGNLIKSKSLFTTGLWQGGDKVT